MIANTWRSISLIVTAEMFLQNNTVKGENHMVISKLRDEFVKRFLNMDYYGAY